MHYLMFENGVVSNGSQATFFATPLLSPFENGVVSNGSQAQYYKEYIAAMFENGVVSNGSQAYLFYINWFLSFMRKMVPIRIIIHICQ